MIDLEQLPTLHRASAGRTEARRLQRLAREARLHRLRPGVYVDASEWSGLDSRQRHVLGIQAVAPLLPDHASVSHSSAAAVYGWPNTGAWPLRAQFSSRRGARAPSLNGACFREPVLLGGSVPGGSTVFGVPVVDPATAAVGAAIDLPFVDAVAVMSQALRDGAEPDRIAGWAAERRGKRFGRTVGAVAAVADARHESPAEALFAARGSEIGLPRLEPQHEFARDDGGIDRVDFWIPSLGVVVEVDGRQKYEDAQMLRGRSPSDVLWLEKKREDRIRARPEVRAFVRVTWWHLMEADRLRALFRTHGIVFRSVDRAGTDPV